LSTEPTQRLFFALWPPLSVRLGLQQQVRELALSAGRTTDPRDLHLTLAFLGSLTAPQQTCAEQVAGSVTAHPFTLQLDRIDCWDRPGILWCGPSQWPAALDHLVEQLWQGVAACGVTREGRRYRPHVTLARRASGVAAALLRSPLEWPVDEFVLAAASSVALPPRYRVVGRWRMAL